MRTLSILALFIAATLATEARAEFDCRHFIKVEAEVADNARAVVHDRAKNRTPEDDAVDIAYEQGRISGVLEIIERLQAECF